MATFVGERPAPIGIAGSNAAHVIVLEHNAIGIGPPFRRVVGVACCARCVCSHIHVHVAVSGPIDELLHLIGPVVGQFAFDAVDSRMAVPLRVAFGQTKFHVNIGGNVQESRHDLSRVGIQLSEVSVEHGHGVQNLRRLDVLRAIVMDHMKHHGNDVQLSIPRSAFEPRIGRVSDAGLF